MASLTRGKGGGACICLPSLHHCAVIFLRKNLACVSGILAFFCQHILEKFVSLKLLTWGVWTHILGKHFVYSQPPAESDNEELQKLFKLLSTIFNIASYYK